MKVFVMRGIGMCAKLSRRPLPVSGMPGRALAGPAVAAQDAVLVSTGAARRRALVVAIDRAAPVGDGAVVDHRDQRRGDALAHAAAEGRDFLAVEVAFQSVADRFVQQHAGPAGTEHDGHRAGRRIDRAEVAQRLLRRGVDPTQVAIVPGQRVELDASAAAGRALLALALFLGNAGDAEANERLDVSDYDAVRCDDQNDLVLHAEAGEHVGDARVVASGGDVDLVEQADLVLEADVERTSPQRIEVVCRPDRLHRDRLCVAAGVGDRARRLRGDAQRIEGDVIAVGTAGFVASQRRARQR
jgi:hypothetical protein